jgi:hypothetical protein
MKKAGDKSVEKLLRSRNTLLLIAALAFIAVVLFALDLVYNAQAISPLVHNYEINNMNLPDAPTFFSSKGCSTCPFGYFKANNKDYICELNGHQGRWRPVANTTWTEWTYNNTYSPVCRDYTCIRNYGLFCRKGYKDAFWQIKQ